MAISGIYQMSRVNFDCKSSLCGGTTLGDVKPLVVHDRNHPSKKGATLDPGCWWTGDLLGMKSYAVMWGLFHKPL